MSDARADVIIITASAQVYYKNIRIAQKSREGAMRPVFALQIAAKFGIMAV